MVCCLNLLSPFFCCNWAWLNRLKDKNAIWSKSSTYNNYILSPFHAYNVSWCQPIRNKMVFIVALLQTLINEGMPLSVDMRNLRSIYIYYCTTFTMWLGLVLYWFILRKCVSADVVQKQTREHVPIYLSRFTEQITCFMLFWIKHLSTH